MRIIDADKIPYVKCSDSNIGIGDFAYKLEIDRMESVDAIPTQAVKDAIAEIIEEKDFAYADFEQYKVDILGVNPEYVEDELPNDDFRYGMERCLEIIKKHTGVNI